MDVLIPARRARLAATLLALSLAPGARADEDARIVDVTPARSDSLLLCRITTAGLPDRRSTETIQSGLPAMIVVAVSMLDAAGHERGTSRAEIRIEPDLWENVIVVRTPLADHRLPSLDAVAELLARPAPLPVAPLRFVDAVGALTLRVRLAVHPLAPTERAKVHALFGGGEREPDRREVSIGVGSLVRYFLGRTPEEDWVSEITSAPFRRASLPAPPSSASTDPSTRPEEVAGEPDE